MTLIFHDSNVSSAGTLITTTATSMSDSWATECDLGDNALNESLRAVQATVDQSLLGMNAQVLRLGQAALDAVTTWRETDQHLS